MAIHNHSPDNEKGSSFFPILLVSNKKVYTFAPQYRDVLPAKVHLAVLNWERECESPTVPQLWTPLWPWSKKAIAHLGEKALQGGGKSEDQPSYG